MGALFGVCRAVGFGFVFPPRCPFPRPPPSISTPSASLPFSIHCNPKFPFASSLTPIINIHGFSFPPLLHFHCFFLLPLPPLSR